MNNLIKQLAETGMGWEEGVHYFIDDEENFYRLLLDAWKMWNPLTDWNDCMMLVEQMAELGAEVDIMIDNRSTCAIFVMKDSLGQSDMKDMKEAICMAAAKALGIDAK